jgi:hypothetical protein
VNNLAVAEDALAPRHLSVEQPGPGRISFGFTAEGTANCGQSHITRLEYPYAVFMGLQEPPTTYRFLTLNIAFI